MQYATLIYKHPDSDEGALQDGTGPARPKIGSGRVTVRRGRRMRMDTGSLGPVVTVTRMITAAS
jgi:hypothetical protein